MRNQILLRILSIGLLFFSTKCWSQELSFAKAVSSLKKISYISLPEFGSTESIYTTNDLDRLWLNQKSSSCLNDSYLIKANEFEKLTCTRVKSNTISTKAPIIEIMEIRFSKETHAKEYYKKLKKLSAQDFLCINSSPWMYYHKKNSMYLFITRSSNFKEELKKLKKYFVKNLP